MSSMRVSFKFKMPTDLDYTMVKTYVKEYDREDRWPVERYVDDQRTIMFKTVDASVDEVGEFVQLLNQYYKAFQNDSQKYVEESPNSEAAQKAVDMIRNHELSIEAEGKVKYLNMVKGKNTFPFTAKLTEGVFSPAKIDFDKGIFEKNTYGR